MSDVLVTFMFVSHCWSDGRLDAAAQQRGRPARRPRPTGTVHYLSPHNNPPKTINQASWKSCRVESEQFGMLTEQPGRQDAVSGRDGPVCAMLLRTADCAWAADWRLQTTVWLHCWGPSRPGLQWGWQGAANISATPITPGAGPGQDWSGARRAWLQTATVQCRGGNCELIKNVGWVATAKIPSNSLCPSDGGRTRRSNELLSGIRLYCVLWPKAGGKALGKGTGYCLDIWFQFK